MFYCHIVTSLFLERSELDMRPNVSETGRRPGLGRLESKETSEGGVDLSSPGGQTEAIMHRCSRGALYCSLVDDKNKVRLLLALSIVRLACIVS